LVFSLVEGADLPVLAVTESALLAEGRPVLVLLLVLATTAGPSTSATVIAVVVAALVAATAVVPTVSVTAVVTARVAAATAVTAAAAASSRVASTLFVFDTTFKVNSVQFEPLVVVKGQERLAVRITGCNLLL
jgi:hypothetical protein